MIKKYLKRIRKKFLGPGISRKYLKKIGKKLVKTTGFKIIGDLLFTGVMYGLTRNITLTLGTLSVTKVASTAAYVAYDELDIESKWKKAAGWEVIITGICAPINILMTGSIWMTLLITLCMKAMLPLHVVYEHIWRTFKED